MKIHIITSNNLLIGLDVARILGADIALVEKPGDKTAAYILTKEGGNLMSQTVLRKHNSVDADCDFYLILSDLEGSKVFLEKKFTVEYITTQNEPVVLTHSVLIDLQESADVVYRFTCQTCERPATVTDSALGTGWKTKHFVTFTSSCNHSNRFNVAEFVRKYSGTAFR